MDLHQPTACRVAEIVNSGETSAFSVIEKYLQRLSQSNDSFNVFVSTAGEEALKQARAVDEKIGRGIKLPLAGVPLSVKDDLCYSTLTTGLGSPALKAFIPPYSATAVERLVAAGAVVIGKTNIDNLGIGSATSTSPAGPTINPWNDLFLAGSAGAAAVAAGLALLALESDSGGSLRQGASTCGLFGLRPTMGRISRYGLNTFSSSFGQVGLTATVAEDLLAGLTIISGFDPRDFLTAPFEAKKDLPNSIEKSDSLRIGVAENLFNLAGEEQRSILESTVERIRATGYKTENIELKYFTEALRAYYVIAVAESSSNLARFDGIRFGEPVSAENLDQLYRRSRSLAFGPETRRRTVFGVFLLSEGNFDRYYSQALKIRKKLQQEIADTLGKFDLLLLPVALAPSALVEEEKSFLDLYERDIFTAPLSLAGLPSLSLPAGEIGKVPVGFQLVGAPFEEEKLIQAGGRIAPQIELPHQG